MTEDRIVPKIKFAAFVLTLPMIAGCAGVSDVTRSRTAIGGPMISTSGQASYLTEQTAALEGMTRDILRKSTLRGTAIGAVAGCGLALVSTSAKGRCLTGAVAGGAIGAVAGHAHGQREVRRRVEIVELSRVMPSIAKATDQMEIVSRDLPALLAAQEAEMASLRQQAAKGAISEEDMTSGLARIQATRQELARALSLSAAQAREAHAALKSAQDQGQEGMHWYLNATERLEAEAVSARSTIKLI